MLSSDKGKIDIFNKIKIIRNEIKQIPIPQTKNTYKTTKN